MESSYSIDTGYSFSHGPLLGDESIRLIELQPSASSNAEIRCGLLHTTLRECRDDIYDNYTALSYVWGDPNETRDILVNGQRLAVTTNLFSALQDLRHQTKTLHLWADAICINQRDTEEKATQILMMGKIYATAVHTVIYLGSLSEEEISILSHHRPAADMDIFYPNVLQLMMSKPWWTRVWTFQELVFSKDPYVQLGRFRWPWNWIHDHTSRPAESQQRLESLHILRRGGANSGSRLTSFPSSQGLDVLEIMLEMHRARKTHHSQTRHVRLPRSHRSQTLWGHISPLKRRLSSMQENSLFNLLKSRRGTHATDSRDMVFALIGFASDDPHEMLAVDYSKSCALVYQDLIRYLINTFGLHREFLAQAGESLSPGRPLDMASWATDWSTYKRALSTVPPMGPLQPDDIPHIWFEPPENTPALIYVDECFYTVLTCSSTLLAGGPTHIKEFEEAFHRLLDGGHKYNREACEALSDRIYNYWQRYLQDFDITPPTDLYQERDPSHLLAVASDLKPMKNYCPTRVLQPADIRPQDRHETPTFLQDPISRLWHQYFAERDPIYSGRDGPDDDNSSPLMSPPCWSILDILMYCWLPAVWERFLKNRRLAWIVQQDKELILALVPGSAQEGDISLFAHKAKSSSNFAYNILGRPHSAMNTPHEGLLTKIEEHADLLTTNIPWINARGLYIAHCTLVGEMIGDNRASAYGGLTYRGGSVEFANRYLPKDSYRIFVLT